MVQSIGHVSWVAVYRAVSKMGSTPLFDRNSAAMRPTKQEQNLVEWKSGGPVETIRPSPVSQVLLLDGKPAPRWPVRRMPPS